MSNLTDFFPSGGGGLTPKFEEFNASGTFTPSQALIDAGGYIEVFLVAGGAGGGASNYGASGGEAFIKKMYLTSTTGCSVTIGAGGSAANGGNSSFTGSSAGGNDLSATGGKIGDVGQDNVLSSSWGAGSSNSYHSSAGNGVFGYGAGSGYGGGGNGGGVDTPKANSGQAGAYNRNGASGYCLIKWYE